MPIVAALLFIFNTLISLIIAVVIINAIISWLIAFDVLNIRNQTVYPHRQRPGRHHPSPCCGPCTASFPISAGLTSRRSS